MVTNAEIITINRTEMEWNTNTFHRLYDIIISFEIICVIVSRNEYIKVKYSTDIITHRNMNSTDWMLFKNFILIVKLHSYLFNKWMKWEIVYDEVAQNRKLSSWLFILKFMKKFEYFMYPLCSFIFFPIFYVISSWFKNAYFSTLF